MPEAYEVHDARLILERVVVSAANALSVYTDLVPVNKVWTVTAAALYPNVAETQVYWFSISGRSSTQFPITVPISIALAPVLLKYYPCVTEGMEIKLYPGERLWGFRDAATAGSTISIVTRIIETDLPYYSYTDPLRKTLNASAKHGQAFRASSGAVTTGGGGGAIGGGHPTGGGGGGALPV
jgi:hypothetical protein